MQPRPCTCSGFWREWAVLRHDGRPDESTVAKAVKEQRGQTRVNGSWTRVERSDVRPSVGISQTHFCSFECFVATTSSSRWQSVSVLSVQ